MGCNISWGRTALGFTSEIRKTFSGLQWERDHQNWTDEDGKCSLV